MEEKDLTVGVPYDLHGVLVKFGHFPAESHGRHGMHKQQITIIDLLAPITLHGEQTVTPMQFNRQIYGVEQFRVVTHLLHERRHQSYVLPKEMIILHSLI